MKKSFVKCTLVAGLCAAGVVPAAAQSVQELIIKGKISGLPDSLKVTLVNQEVEEGKKECEGFTAGGAFALRGRVDYPVFCKLNILRYNAKVKRYVTVVSVPLMAENTAMTLTSSVPFDSLAKADYSFKQEKLLRLSGGKALEEWDAYRKEVYELDKNATLAGYKAANKYFETMDNPDSMRVYDALRKAANNALYEADMRFVAGHPTYHVSAYIVDRELRKTFGYTTSQIKRLAMYGKMCSDTVRANRIMRLEPYALRYAKGEPYTDIDVTVSDGEVRKLSEFVPQGIYALLDFWASWCGPCRVAIPKVLEMYKQSEGQLKVCSISVDQKEEAWRKAMDEEKMPWQQLWLSKEQMEKACEVYDIRFIPRLVLIDGKGKIVCITNSPDEIWEALAK